jgi:hypothetical protein
MSSPEDLMIEQAQARPEAFMLGIFVSRNYLADRLAVFYDNPHVLSDTAKESMQQNTIVTAIRHALDQKHAPEDLAAVTYGVMSETEHILSGKVAV